MTHHPNRRAFLGGAAALAGLASARCTLVREIEAQGARPLSEAYDLTPGISYLNHASIGTVPRVVREAHARYLEVCETNPWLHVWGDAWNEAVESTHARAAAFCGCATDDLAITRSTTEAFCLAAAGLPLGTGDEVLFSSLNHVGASAAWEQQAGRRGFKVRRFPFPVADVPGLSDDDVVEIHLREVSDDTRVLVLPHVDNIVGLRHPLRAIARAVRARGVRWVLVDGAQCIGMLPVELRTLEVDLYATSAHKWLQAPKGTGLLYVNASLRDHLHPIFYTWGQERWSGTTRAYTDYGTRDLPKLLALGDALEFQERILGVERETHDRALFEHARARADAHPRLSWRSPRAWEQGSAVLAVGLEDTRAEPLAAALFQEEGLVVRPFDRPQGSHLRVSPNVATTHADLDRFFDAVERLSS